MTMPDQEKDAPKSFKYSIWDTRTVDDQSQEALVKEYDATKQQSQDPNESNQ